MQYARTVLRKYLEASNSIAITARVCSFCNIFNRTLGNLERPKDLRKLYSRLSMEVSFGRKMFGEYLLMWG